MYTVSSDGTLSKEGRMMYCVNGETSCTANCAAFEERAKGRAFLYCVNREIITKPEAVSSVVNALKDTPSADPFGKNAKEADPLGVETKPKKTKRTK